MIEHDGETHHPLGSASYYFKRDLIPFIDRHCDRPRITLHIGAQPNSDPHIGNIITFTTAFALASALKEKTAREIRINFVFVETAPAAGQDVIIKGVRYQKSLATVGDFLLNQRAFTKVLERLSLLSGVPCDVKTQDFWRQNPKFGLVLRDIISKRSLFGPRLSPETHELAIRAPCPLCGLAEKHGLTNQYHDDGRIIFTCPTHGEFHVNLHFSDQTQHLGLNTPLRNLVRALLCREDQDTSWILCTGADYAGFYQEQLCYRLVEQGGESPGFPMIFYAPLILDWSGSKLSKSLYVKEGAYKYLCEAGLGYMLDANVFLDAEFGLEALFAEVQQWVAEPYKLFRSYSVEYLHRELISRGMKLVKYVAEIETTCKNLQ